MSLQRRLMAYLLVCAPVVWGLALLWSVGAARREVNEMFDTSLVRMAYQLQFLTDHPPLKPGNRPPGEPRDDEVDLDDLSTAVWDARGRPLLASLGGPGLPWRAGASGFEDLAIAGEDWRIYYLPVAGGQGLVAVGQKVYERDELVWNFIAAQLLPWLLVLPLLLAGLAWAVRAALAPLNGLAGELTQRRADDLRTVPLANAPTELRPMLAAMNGLFGRIEETLARERRFTADAAHELRTPISVLAAQWEVVRASAHGADHERAARALDAGLARMSRLIDQMLGLSRLDATERLKDLRPLDWQALVETAMSDVLPLAERRRIELACEWAEGDRPAPAWSGDTHLMGLLLRNLLDNAVRYAADGATVTLRFGPARLAVENPVPPGSLSPGALQGWGERFHRDDGQAEAGSGLGVSIARRIASLHGLVLSHRLDDTGWRVIAELSVRPASPSAP